jgi:hypothetical protein
MGREAACADVLMCWARGAELGAEGRIARARAGLYKEEVETEKNRKTMCVYTYVYDTARVSMRVFFFFFFFWCREVLVKKTPAICYLL